MFTFGNVWERAGTDGKETESNNQGIVKPRKNRLGQNTGTNVVTYRL